MLWRCQGDVKSGKTLTAVALAFTRFYAHGYSVFSNMAECRFAERVELDDLLTFQEHIRNGVLLLDEAHTLLDPRSAGSNMAAQGTYFLTQAGKRNLLVIYTSHLDSMVLPTVRQLTTLTFKCRTPDQGRHIFVNVCDERALRQALADGRSPNPDVWWVLRGSKFFRLYDCDEVIDPFARARSRFATRAGKAIAKTLGQWEGAAPVERAEPQFSAQLEEMQRLFMGELEGLRRGLRPASPRPPIDAPLRFEES